mgnify:CR=1 FL=1
MKVLENIMRKLRLLPHHIEMTRFALVLSFLNSVFFHVPFSVFVLNNVDYGNCSGIILIASLALLMVAVNFFLFYLICFLFRFVRKLLIALLFSLNAIALYFINTYSIIVDESMIGNVLISNFEESSSYFSVKLVVYILFFAIIPGLAIVRINVTALKLRKFLFTSSITLSFIIALVFANAANWLWIDKNSKKLGGLAMPWSYSVNMPLFFIHKHQKNKKEILLPDAVIKDDEKAVVVLVIGESARSQNFSLYGYGKNTNPLLSKTPNVSHFAATSCATYTTAGVKCILEHAVTDDLYEILPNYLYRNNVEVI